MKYFDAHAHYFVRQFNRDRDRLLPSMHKDGVEYIINSTSSKELPQALLFAKKYDFLYLSIMSDDYYDESDDPKANEHVINKKLAGAIEDIKRLCAENKKIVAWGEFGMDFRRAEPTKKEVAKQTFWFKKDLEAARQIGLPVVIHSGDACQPVFDTLREADMPDYGYGRGMIHCYLGTPKMALEYIEMGYLISITGVVTHRSPRGRNLVEVVKKVPMDKMLIETDCPYLTPEPIRNERNDSGYLRFVVDKIAEIKNCSPEEVAEITMFNAKSLFRIK